MKPSPRSLLVSAVLLLALPALATPVAAKPSNPPISPTEQGSTVSLRDGSVTIERDRYGTPNIYAKTRYNLFFGYGYAAATDRLFQLEMTKRSANGTVSEVLGPDYVGTDKAVRSNFDPASIRQQYDALSRRDRDVIDGYAAGVNSWIDTVMADQQRLLPKQYLDFTFRPSRWTGVDVAMITVLTMSIRFSDFNAELQNLADLQELQATYGPQRALTLFDQIKWKVDPKAPSTVPRADLKNSPLSGKQESSSPKSPPKATSKTPNSLVSTGSAAKAADTLTQRQRSVGTSAPGQGHDSFSNLMLVGQGKAAHANSLLLNGPQFGFFNPSYVYSVGLHGAGFDVVGNTPFAYPVVLFGHNKKIAWGATAGNGDTVDIYQERLNPMDPQQYLYQGRYRDMKVRTETIKVKGGADESIKVYSTVHGLVSATQPSFGVAYSKKRSWAGRELDVLFSWLDSTQATNWQQWKKHAEDLPISINWYYTDRAGNIGYFAAGHFPIRPANQDRRLPVSGIGTMEWQGIQPADTGNPQVLNPKQKYLANWNNSPRPGFANSDFIPWGRADRVEVLQKMLEADPKINASELWNMMERAAYRDINVDYFYPYLKRAVRGLPADSKERQVFSALSAWDRSNTDTDNDGHYDSAGTVIMQTWLAFMLTDVLKDDLPPGIFPAYSQTGYPTADVRFPGGSQNIQPGTKVLYNALLGNEASVPQNVDLFNGQDPKALIRLGLKQTYDKLASTYGDDPSTWLAPAAPQIFSTKNYLGVPSASPDEELVAPIFMNRGTENNLEITSRQGIVGFDVVAPGESGFVAPDGRRSRHYSDQFDLFINFGLKPVCGWLQTPLANPTVRGRC